MNILWVSHHVPYPPTMGALLRSYNLLKQVSKEHHVYLIALNQKALIPDKAKLAEAEAALTDFCPVVEIIPFDYDLKAFGRFRLIAANFFSTLPYDVTWTRSEKMARAIERALSEPIDLIHFDTIGLAQYRHLTGDVPVVLNHHNVESHMLQRRIGFERNPMRKLYFALEARDLRKYEEKVCHQFHANIVVSDLDAERLRIINPAAAVASVPNGVDIEYFQPGKRLVDSEQSLLFVGGLTWYPNRDAAMHFLKEMWPTLSHKFPKLKFYLVGRCPEKDRRNIMHRNRNVIAPGFVEDVREWMRKTTVFICPMRTGGGTRLKILDAMACGKPVVATSMACEGIDVRNGGHVLIADTPSEFCSAIEKLLKSPSLRSALSKNARSLVERKYSWNSIGKNLCGIYSRILDEAKNEGGLVQN